MTTHVSRLQVAVPQGPGACQLMRTSDLEMILLRFSGEKGRVSGSSPLIRDLSACAPARFRTYAFTSPTYTTDRVKTICLMNLNADAPPSPLEQYCVRPTSRPVIASHHQFSSAKIFEKRMSAIYIV